MLTGGRRRRRWRRLWILLAVLLGVAALVVAGVELFARASNPPKPGAFYRAPSPPPNGPPGEVIRVERLNGAPAGSLGWRLLYLSRSYTGHPTAVSGLLFTPIASPPPGGRDIVAITHGTLGVAPNCAPSNTPSVWPQILDGFAQFIAAGDAVVVPDYEGLGTAGPHPYLVGESEAWAALDEVRAAHAFAPAGASTRFVVWGVSQGGQAALFTGQLASSYAPGLKLLGVAAGAPATDLAELFKVNRDTPFGRILSAYAFFSWARVYPGVSLAQVVTPLARPIVSRIAQVCLNEQGGVISAGVIGSLLSVSYLRADPWNVEPWKRLLAENSPGHARIPAPLAVVQGEADALVRPPVTAAFVNRLCSEGETVEYRPLPGVSHLEIGPRSASFVAGWVAERFAGRAAPSTCRR